MKHLHYFIKQWDSGSPLLYIVNSNVFVLVLFLERVGEFTGQSSSSSCKRSSADYLNTGVGGIESQPKHWSVSWELYIKFPHAPQSLSNLSLVES